MTDSPRSEPWVARLAAAHWAWALLACAGGFAALLAGQGAEPPSGFEAWRGASWAWLLAGVLHLTLLALGHGFLARELRAGRAAPHWLLAGLLPAGVCALLAGIPLLRGADSRLLLLGYDLPVAVLLVAGAGTSVLVLVTWMARTPDDPPLPDVPPEAAADVADDAPDAESTRLHILAAGLYWLASAAMVATAIWLESQPLGR